MTRIRVGPDEAFQGAGILRSAATAEVGRAEKPLVTVKVNDQPVEAVLDTGGVWFVLHPTLAYLSGITEGRYLHQERLSIRGLTVPGRVYRHPVELVSVEGAGVEVEMSLFVPDVDEDEWPLPSFLGWQGCLSRFRFALDAEAERFYFGILG